MATNYNLNITRGSNFSVRLIAKDENGTPINLSGYSANAQVRHHYSSTGVLLDLSPTPVEPKASGYIDIYLSGTQTSGVPIVQGVYDLEISAGSYTNKLIKGYANIFPEVSR